MTEELGAESPHPHFGGGLMEKGRLTGTSPAGYPARVNAHLKVALRHSR
jgi:hypothetical protein